MRNVKKDNITFYKLWLSKLAQIQEALGLVKVKICSTLTKFYIKLLDSTLM